MKLVLNFARRYRDYQTRLHRSYDVSKCYKKKLSLIIVKLANDYSRLMKNFELNISDKKEKTNEFIASCAR